jgi:uncharacterized protein YjiS (DUF1127 family)
MANTSTAQARVAATDAGRLTRLRQAWRNWRQYRRTLEELASLDDRELQDLGISRLVIRDIAYESVYGRRPG